MLTPTNQMTSSIDDRAVLLRIAPRDDFRKNDAAFLEYIGRVPAATRIRITPLSEFSDYSGVEVRWESGRATGRARFFALTPTLGAFIRDVLIPSFAPYATSGEAGKES